VTLDRTSPLKIEIFSLGCKIALAIAVASRIVHPVEQVFAAEGSRVEVGSTIALIENYWAVMTLKANGKGILTKTFFKPGTSVKIGDPIAIISADGEALPYGTDHAILEVGERKRNKPHR
jgi:biotin carboxyl carrier protein